MRFVIFQINTDFLINQLKNIFTQDTLNSAFVSKIQIVLSIVEAFGHINLIPHFNVFTTDEVCNISNKEQPPSNSGKCQYFYTRDFTSLFHFKKKLAPSITNVFRNIHFLPHFHNFY